ncbi:putative toxin-antitoxin system toxin component, PIN family [Candidatus Daviesbacteria bacterium RIFOXYD1_FULL_41_10]|uniref:Putative toxin-antitoxin system toxin component, PIN family n=1 Tax=Candidatus Daviesbacteria bacterium RIFOXYD1_FULL_41_10 TaxID=1797801 RepID=A0A1F5N1V6_9BACT|nr:MAG: putative toxin-antitoxin system toxin component, PIN family [Candidatus Daviesbacteria bacterium RIFOXYD1_FULL_41_10]
MKRLKPKSPRIYLDASVIIAALLSSKGGSAKIIELARLGYFVAVTSQTVIEEIEEHSLKIKKNKLEIRKYIAYSGIVVRERILISDIEEIKKVDVSDAHLIAGARLTECSFLISLDKKHLLKKEIKDYFKPLKIITPGELLKMWS